MRQEALWHDGRQRTQEADTGAVGLPNTAVLGENAKLELRMDAYNVFNNLNFNPNDISNNVGSSNFGTISGALSGRAVTLTASRLA